MKSEPQKEHAWLQKLVGEWTYETEVAMCPDQPPSKVAGRESVRMLGGLWVLAEGKGQMPGGGEATSLMTLGFDPQKGRYVGTWVGSMMSYLWLCDGELDTGGRALTLDAEGPSMTGDGSMTKYRDIIAFESDDCRTLTARVQGADGRWSEMMSVRYQRQR